MVSQTAQTSCSGGSSCYRTKNKDNHGRTRLPDDRPAYTIKFKMPFMDKVVSEKVIDGKNVVTVEEVVRDVKFYLNIGLYPCGCLGEMFIRTGKEGEMIRGILDAFATMFSISLQHGAPLETLLKKCLHLSFPPNGPTGDARVPMTSSIMDFIANLVAMFAGVERWPGEETHPNPLILALSEEWTKEQ